MAIAPRPGMVTTAIANLPSPPGGLMSQLVWPGAKDAVKHVGRAMDTPALLPPSVGLAGAPSTRQPLAAIPAAASANHGAALPCS
eukprot:5660678-Pyramimonas_sp.AAC.1